MLICRYGHAYGDDARGSPHARIRRPTNILPQLVRTWLGAIQPRRPLLTSLVRRRFCAKHGLFCVLPRIIFFIWFIFHKESSSLNLKCEKQTQLPSAANCNYSSSMLDTMHLIFSCYKLFIYCLC